VSRLWAMIRAATIADVFVLVAALTLVVALLYPRWGARAFRTRVASAVADVEALGVAARRLRASQGRWPTSAAPGEAPPELSGLAGPDGLFSRRDYTLLWTTWEVVDSVEAPPEPGPPAAAGDAPRRSAGPRMLPITRVVGAVGVHASDDALLVELLRHYGSDVSFVLDTIWMLVLPER
jgi:hypothetical protein